MLEQLLVSLKPTETELLANYPNPFNPETWIPYRLAEDAFVTLTIYDLMGRVVRTLDVGHRIAAVYERQSKAILLGWQKRVQRSGWKRCVLLSPVCGELFGYAENGDSEVTARVSIHIPLRWNGSNPHLLVREIEISIVPVTHLNGIFHSFNLPIRFRLVASEDRL